jgi:hypothetical protein
MKNKKTRNRLEIEETDFVYRVIASSSIMLSPEEAADPDYLSGEKLHPAKEYAIEVYSRMIPLVDRIYALNEIFGLLEITSFPIKLGSHDFSRFEWLRLIIDLIHVRFTSIRDSAILIAAGVLEIHLPPRQLKLSSFDQMENSKKILKILRIINLIGRETREARNLNFHRSQVNVPSLEDFGQDVFHSVSKMEVWGRLHQETVDELTKTYGKSRNRIFKQYDQETRKIVKELRKLFDELDLIYVNKLDTKFGRIVS